MTRRLVFASDAAVRFEGGGACIYAGRDGARVFATDRPALVGWLSRFSVPTVDDEALALLGDAGRAVAMHALAVLVESGALVDADAAAATVADPDAAHAASRRHLARMSQSVYALACDVAGFGPHAETRLATRGAALEPRLRRMLDDMHALRRELAGLRAPYLAEQLQRLGVTPGARGMRLHIGCGPYPIEGWVNLDVHPAPLSTNVLWGLPLADASVRVIYLSHLLEHLFYPGDVQPFLDELLRVLEPGGVLRIVVPDIETCIDAYARGDLQFFEGRCEHWGGRDAQPTRLEHFLAYAGAGPDPGWLLEAHKFGYDHETLARALERSGFVDIRRSSFMGSAHADLQVDTHSQVAAARHADGHYSLFVEACRPKDAA